MKIRNVSARALDLPNGGSLSPGESTEVKSNYGLSPMIDAGLISEVTETPKKKEGSK